MRSLECESIYKYTTTTTTTTTTPHIAFAIRQNSINYISIKLQAKLLFVILKVFATVDVIILNINLCFYKVF